MFRKTTLQLLTGNSLILLITIGFASSCKPGQNKLELSKFLVDSIQSQTVPDTRTEVFSVKASYSGGGILIKGKTTSSEALSKLRAVLKNQHVEFTDSIILLPDPALKGKSWGLVTLSVANLRYTPAHSAEMATQALMGSPLKVLQEENGWFLVQTPDQYIAWTESAGIALLTSMEMDRWKSSERIIFLDGTGHVLQEPEPGARPVTDMVTGGILSLATGKKSGSSFIPVNLPDGREGFIPASACKNFKEWSEQVIPDTVALIRTAFGQMGAPYLWGGTSVKGFDCSGFTKTVYLTGGLILSRDASQQVLQGTGIPNAYIWKGLKAGDLLFFGRKANGEQTEKVSHVGMYLSGSEFIHCSGMVKINSLDSTRINYKPYYVTNLLHVKRIIGSPEQPVSFKSHPWYH